MARPGLFAFAHPRPHQQQYDREVIRLPAGRVFVLTVSRLC